MTEIKNSLESWLTDWQTARVLERFDELARRNFEHENLADFCSFRKNIRQLSPQRSKRFWTEAISLEEGLHRIADAFSDSEKEFFNCAKNLIVLEDFINGAVKREKIWTYLAVCETTQDEKIEYFREKLLQIIDESYKNPSETLNREMENLWKTFHTRFTEHFAVKHDTVMKSHHLQEKFDEILRSDEWWEFENLSQSADFSAKLLEGSARNLPAIQRIELPFRRAGNAQNTSVLRVFVQFGENSRMGKIAANFTGNNQYAGAKFLSEILQCLSEILIPLIEQFSAKNSRRRIFRSGAASHTNSGKTRRNVRF